MIMMRMRMRMMIQVVMMVMVVRVSVVMRVVDILMVMRIGRTLKVNCEPDHHERHEDIPQVKHQAGELDAGNRNELRAVARRGVVVGGVLPQRGAEVHETDQDEHVAQQRRVVAAVAHDERVRNRRGVALERDVWGTPKGARAQPRRGEKRNCANGGRGVATACERNETNTP